MNAPNGGEELQKRHRTEKHRVRTVTGDQVAGMQADGCSSVHRPSDGDGFRESVDLPRETGIVENEQAAGGYFTTFEEDCAPPLDAGSRFQEAKASGRTTCARWRHMRCRP